MPNKERTDILPTSNGPVINGPVKLKHGEAGKANLRPGGKKFSSTYQPDPQRIKDAWAKKKLLKDILTTPLNKSPEWSKWITLTAKYLQKDEKEITISDVMDLRMAQKAIQKSDVFAYQALKDRAFGKPESKTTLANDADHPVTPLNIEQVNVLIEAIKKA